MDRVIAGRVGALGQHPFSGSLQACLVEEVPERRSRVHHAMDHAVGELAAVQLRAAPLHAGIGSAFEKIDAVFAGNRFRSSMVTTSGLSISPLIISR